LAPTDIKISGAHLDSVYRLAGLRKNFMLKRVPTGVAGLDPMIQGGFLERSLVLVTGPPGSGKRRSTARRKLKSS